MSEILDKLDRNIDKYLKNEEYSFESIIGKK